MKGYWGGMVGAWILIFIGALIYEMVRHGLLPGLEHGWWTAVKAASVLCLLWPLPVLAIIALLVWLDPSAAPNRVLVTGHHRRTAHR